MVEVSFKLFDISFSGKYLYDAFKLQLNNSISELSIVRLRFKDFENFPVTFLQKMTGLNH